MVDFITIILTFILKGHLNRHRESEGGQYQDKTT